MMQAQVVCSGISYDESKMPDSRGTRHLKKQGCAWS